MLSVNERRTHSLVGQFWSRQDAQAGWRRRGEVRTSPPVFAMPRAPSGDRQPAFPHFREDDGGRSGLMSVDRFVGRLAIFASLAAVAGAAPGAFGAQPPHHKVHHAGKPQKGVASFYRPAKLGSKMANGEVAKPGGLTAASKTLPLGAKAKVTSTETGRSVKVTVTDRGPYAKGRILDVSPRAADKLGMKEDGVAPVTVKPLSAPPDSRKPPGG
jgi:rare lipoprotein A